MSISQHQVQGAYQRAVQAPCADMYAASLKCLDDNNYEKEACEEYFERYKECKKQEVASRAARRLEEEKLRR